MHKAELNIAVGEVSESEVDRNSTALLFFQAVRVDAGEGADQGGLAVVDVARRADDNVLHEAAFRFHYGRCRERLGAMAGSQTAGKAGGGGG